MKKILFVEDDAEYRKTIKEILVKENYLVDDVPGPIEAIEVFEDGKYDLIISDFMMKAMDGIRFLRYIKKISPESKTMILTASPTFESEMEALNIKIDQYLVKEKRVEILLKYIEELIEAPVKVKRKNRVLESKSEGIEIDLDARVVRKDGVNLEFSPKEYGITKILLEQRGIAISRDYLLDQLWDKQNELIDSRVIDVHIKSIRNKLQIQSISSVRGYGYKWDE